MLRSKIALVVVFCSGVACAPKQSLVSIDLAAVPMQDVAIVVPLVRPSTSSLSGTEAIVPDMRARNVLVGSGERFAKDAIELARKNQERAFKQALSELKDAYLAEAKSGALEESLKLKLVYEGKFKGLYVSLRKLFDEHADKVGPLWTRLATLKGFPEKSGRTREPSEVDFLGRAEAKEAVEIKKTISSADAEYRAEVARRVEELRQELRADSTILEAQRISALDAAEIKAKDEATRMVTEVLKGLEASLIKDIERLPAVSGVKIKLRGVTVPRVEMPVDTGSTWTERQRVTRRTELFARLNGYRLVKAGSGVRDVTKEFIVWDKGQAGR